ncbi:MAG TPA: hypothetical protein DEO57_04730, partial [Phycisphaerales bacterium]|nr:hypothetical protein [Phycisphaerales bacterium]
MSYEELNTSIPDEMVHPTKIDQLLVLLDSLSIELINYQDRRIRNGDQFYAPLHTNLKFKRDNPFMTFGLKNGEELIQEQAQQESEDGEAESANTSAAPGHDGGDGLLDESEREAAIEEVSTKRIDDPIRMYLTQMGTIPLLTREEEIRLAKKIETTRMIFRRKVLESDYAAMQAVEILQQVHNGDLPFDRTMRISTAEENAKEKIASRIPVNIATVQRLLKRNELDWERLEGTRVDKATTA